MSKIYSFYVIDNKLYCDILENNSVITYTDYDAIRQLRRIDRI